MGISVPLQAHITMVVFLETLFESENTLLKRTSCCSTAFEKPGLTLFILPNGGSYREQKSFLPLKARRLRWFVVWEHYLGNGITFELWLLLALSVDTVTMSYDIMP